MTHRRPGLSALTSLRFLAALLVFSEHIPETERYAFRYELGESAVGFFFVLSGFILILNYHQKFADKVDWTTLRRFYIARVARIYPMQVITTILAVIVLASVGDGHAEHRVWTGFSAGERLSKIAAALLFLQPWESSESIVFGVNPPAWSIADEAWFYLLFPFVAWYVIRAFRMSGAASIIAFAALVWIVVSVSVLSRPVGSWFLYYYPPTRFVDFLVGMLLGLAFLKCVPRGGTLRESCAVFGFAAAVALMPYVPHPMCYALWIMPFSAFVIFVFAAGRGTLSHWAANRHFVALGEASFAFYLIHNVVLVAMRATFGRGIAISIVSFGVALGISVASFYWLETPMRRWIRGEANSEIQPLPMWSVANPLTEGKVISRSGLQS